ncbi:splicing factor 3B subunit 2 isoform X2 [Anopheles ziemanni]|uniref:splicing factor 3B subunit 2 isoform X2 n=1 Tax=Anopheles coustani TaxID=139045 RepID=UPI00265AB404|nr:splicing factor 3B subunit 2 isoform X2 [Anopheles coustani]XP_058168207.1 splicing factor 3B subunit 2 isoform X2 [Anopheles ziemanni]
MDSDLEQQQTNGSMVPPPMPSAELLTGDFEEVDGEWPGQMDPMVEAEQESEQADLSPADDQPQLEEEEEESQRSVLSPPPSLMSLEVENPDESEKRQAELVLPKALEDVLALKTIRAQQLDAEDTLDSPGAVLPGSSYLEGEGAVESDDENANEPPLVDGEGDDSSLQEPDQGLNRVEGKQDKNRRKKKRKKENRKARREQMQKAHEQRLQHQQQQLEKPSKLTVPGKKGPGSKKPPTSQESQEDVVEHSEEEARADTDNPPSGDEEEGADKEKSMNNLNGRKQKASDDDEENKEDDQQTNGRKHTEGDEMETEEQKDESAENDKEPVHIKSRKQRSVKGKKGAKEVVAATKQDDPLEGIEIEYVPEKLSFTDLDPMYRQFYQVFEIFKLDTKSKDSLRAGEDAEKERAAAEAQRKAEERNEDDDDDDDDDDDMGDDRDDKDDKEKISKRKLKKLTRLSVAELKQLVSRPDVVEMHDVTARDPKLLVQLKSHRNTVQVPRHWCFKRKYLQGKRGIEKPPFDLPAFIKKTGIMEMRASLQEKDEAKTLKAKMRERARPKMGKIDIDYQKLHDAFFKWQTKPRMTIHGDLYYEGKEFETRLKEKKPGDLSEELRIALGMPIGPACHKIPPPWLIAQQRYGPPPSYPNLKIPGLNAPIPEGCSFGYHAGGWGKPPVDESGKPLYGDVFGMAGIDGEGGMGEEEIDRTVWGELESESEESSEEEEDEGEDLGGAGAPPDESGLITPAEGLVTPSGLTSGVPAGMETPDTIELRKKKIESEMEDNETPVLYHVLPEKRNERIGTAMMASTHVYDIAAAGGGGGAAAAAAAAASAAAAGGGGRAGRGGQPVDREGMIELALDPSELDLDNEAMAQRYEQQLREQQSHLQKEDLSDMLAEHVARQKSKRKRQQTDTTSKQSKKYKEFKF